MTVTITETDIEPDIKALFDDKNYPTNRPLHYASLKFMLLNPETYIMKPDLSAKISGVLESVIDTDVRKRGEVLLANKMQELADKKREAGLQ